MDLRLVFLAAVICIAACIVSMNLFVPANDAAREQPLAWLYGAATVFGAGVWATHFIAGLAYEPGIPIGYDAGLISSSPLEAFYLLTKSRAIGLAKGR
jgi:diguanylate cyclase